MARNLIKSVLKHQYRRASKQIRENKKDPDPTLYYDRGMICLSLRDNCAAIADFNEAIRLDPNHAEAHFERGKAWYLEGQPHKSRYDFEEAMRLDPLLKHEIEQLQEQFHSFKELTDANSSSVVDRIEHNLLEESFSH